MQAKIIVNKQYIIDEIDNRIYGSFIEHLGRAVYGGIYEPSHITADDMGFRQDVMNMVKEIGVPIIRYPGGNFVSNYCWMDGIGDKSKRPKRLELAWRTIETNEVGIDEFQEWAKRCGSEVMMAVNLGTGTPQDAQNLVEYCNLNTNTYYAELRRKNGFDSPFAIKTWCLGNEMDGSWQTGHKTAQEYGRIATETAKLMKGVDPSIELVVCGSSNYYMPTFGEWELTVLDHSYEYIDYISLHQYYGHLSPNNYADFLAKSVHMDAFIKSVVAFCDTIKAKKHSTKTINLSFDEWNIWSYIPTQMEDWLISPPMLEDIYNFADALLVGCMLITLQNNCDRVKIACLAQLVNVIAPIMAETGGPAWVQTIFYPYMYAAVYGKGKTLKSIITCDSYTTSDHITAPYLETSVIHNEKERKIILFAVNRSLNENMEMNLELQGFENAVLEKHIELYCENLQAINSVNKQIVVPVEREISDYPTLKKHSWNMLIYSY